MISKRTTRAKLFVPKRRLSTFRNVLAIFALALLLTCSSPAHATHVWDFGGSDGDWDNFDNWNPNSSPAGDSITYNATSTGGFTQNQNLIDPQINGVTISGTTSAFTINGNSINLNGDVSLSSTTSSGFTINTPIVLIGANRQFKVVNGRTLTLGGAITGNFALTSRGTAGQTNGVVTYNGAVNNNGLFQLTESVTVNLNVGNHWTGSTNILQGTIVVGIDNALPTATVVRMGQNNLNFNAATLNLNGKNVEIGGLEHATGSNNQSHIVTSSTAATLTINNSSNYTFGAPGIDGRITGAVSLVKEGSGTMTFGLTSSYTGTTTVNAGAITYTALVNNPTIYSGAGTVNFNNGSSLSAATTFGSSFTGQINFNTNMLSGSADSYDANRGDLNLATGTTFSINGHTPQFDELTGLGAINNTAGGSFAPAMLVLGANNGNGGTAVFSGNVTSQFNATNGSISIVKNGNGSQTLSGTISTGQGTMTVNGGILTLGGTNTYTGVTNVNAGTLLVNGSTHASSAVTVATGATLGGTGIIGGSTVIHGIHSPGNSPGIQTFASNLTYEADPDNPIVEWELIDNTVTNQPNPNALFDTIEIGGLLDFADPTGLDLIFDAAGSLVDWTDGFWGISHLGTSGWLLYDVAGATTNFANLSITPENWLDGSTLAFNAVRAGSNFSLIQDGNDIYLNYTFNEASSTPEPSTAVLALFCLASLGLGFRRCRRQRC